MEANNIIKPFITSSEICRMLGVTSTTQWRGRQIEGFPIAINITRKKIVFETEDFLKWVRNRNKEAQTL